ncbi:class III signal peptide-containing protein [Thermococcus paralvinellae]|uniref:class III signal peptide-containing protein n=1 Tax=Thermococcus paralvinellae TaxID=582419 RepID=UPI0006881BA8|nr:class III signal peptide-containing protein [Thermococcus paralvinellae]
MMRKAQGAVEYLFMVAAVLIIVAIVIKYLRDAASAAGSTVSSGVAQLSQELNEQLQSAATE